MMAPLLSAPKSNNTVRVSIIDTTSQVGNVATTAFMEPEISVHPKMEVPAFGFLVEHQSEQGGPKQRYLFDLGVRKDWKNLPPSYISKIEAGGWTVNVEKNVSEILEDGGIALESVNGIIFSHWHWDHTGDPSTFPKSTKLILGPGTKANFLPGYPSDPEGLIDEYAFAGREVIEIDLDSQFRSLEIEGFEALDFFGDGSFYLLNSSGHAIGHMCALARTAPDTFILMGADTCHHCGEFRPSAQVPLPSTVDRKEASRSNASAMSIFPCPGELFTQQIHPNKQSNQPFYTVPDMPDGKGVASCRKEALASREKLISLDACDNVFVLIAHDPSVLGVIDTFPAVATEWRRLGWKDKCQWRFLNDFASGIQK